MEADRDMKGGDPPPKRSKIQSGMHFHEQIGMLSEEVLASVQLQLDLVRSEMAGLYQARRIGTSILEAPWEHKGCS